MSIFRSGCDRRLPRSVSTSEGEVTSTFPNRISLIQGIPWGSLQNAANAAICVDRKGHPTSQWLKARSQVTRSACRSAGGPQLQRSESPNYALERTNGRRRSLGSAYDGGLPDARVVAAESDRVSETLHQGVSVELPAPKERFRHLRSPSLPLRLHHELRALGN